MEVSPEYKRIDHPNIQHMAYLKTILKQVGSKGYIIGPNAKKFDFLAIF